MLPSSRTPEGPPNHCSVCGHEVQIEPSTPPGDATCPFCGNLLWFDWEPLSGSADGERDSDTLSRYQGTFARCFSPDGKIHDIKSTTKKEVIEEMVGVLVSSDRLPVEHATDILDSIMKREDRGSTGIGRGVAVPHTKHAAITEFTGLIGQSKSGIDFHSLDGEPVYMVVLLISPPDRPGDHLRMLEAVSRLLRNWDFSRS